MVEHSSDGSKVGEALDSGLEALGLDSNSSVKEYVSYFDTSVEGSRGLNGAIPCNKIWDASGTKLACVLLFDS